MDNSFKKIQQLLIHKPQEWEILLTSNKDGTETEITTKKLLHLRKSRGRWK